MTVGHVRYNTRIQNEKKKNTSIKLSQKFLRSFEIFLIKPKNLIKPKQLDISNKAQLLRKVLDIPAPSALSPCALLTQTNNGCGAKLPLHERADLALLGRVGVDVIKRRKEERKLQQVARS